MNNVSYAIILILFITLNLISGLQPVIAQQDYETRALEFYDTAQKETNPQTKIDYLEAAVEFKPDFVLARFQLAGLYVDNQNFEKAKNQYNKILDYETDNVYAYNGLGDVFFLEERYKDALDSYQFALKLNSTLKETQDNITKVKNRIRVVDQYEKGQVAFEKGDWQNAKQCFEQVIRLEPKYRDAAAQLKTINRTMINIENYSQGRQFLENATRNQSRTQYEQALTCFERVAADYKDTKSKIREIQQALQKLRQPVQEPIQNPPEPIKKQVEVKPEPKKNNLAADENRAGIAALENHDYESAIAHFRAALDADYNLQSARDYLNYTQGILALDMKRWIDAKLFFEQVSSANPNFQAAQLGNLYARGQIKYNLGEKDAARQLFQEVIQSDSTYRDVVALMDSLLVTAAPKTVVWNSWWLVIIFAAGVIVLVILRVQQRHKENRPIEKSARVGNGFKELTARDLLMGRYTDISELGHGAMGKVYKAKDIKLDRTIVLKTIRLDMDVNEKRFQEYKQRFLREARAAGRLNHPNIITIYDVEEKDDVFFISMEYLNGTNLLEVLRDEKLLAPARAAKIIHQCCQALELAHENNIVHRDIKPSNIMLLRDNFVKIVDFGVAKLDTSTMTHMGTTVGTPSYMSPEQIEGRATDGRSDLFSLGVVFYEMLTGEKPFKGETITTVIAKILKDSPTPPTALKYHLPAKTDTIIEKMLAKEPKSRYQHARNVIADLNKVFKF
ncbi:protein kinase [candidate division KSB1 bacterium]|nr:protein kinase [candidate division KSB1 bacterium]